MLKIEKYISENSDSLGIRKTEIGTIATSLKKLLGNSDAIDYSNDLSKDTIRRPGNYYKYFTARLFEGDVSNLEFLSAVKMNWEEFNKILELWSNEKKAPAVWAKLKYFTLQDIDSRYIFENIIKALKLLGKESYFESAFASFDHLINKEFLINRGIFKSRQELEDFVYDLFFEKESSPFTYERLLLKSLIDTHWQKASTGEIWGIGIDKLKELHNKYFKELLTVEPDIHNAVALAREVQWHSSSPELPSNPAAWGELGIWVSEHSNFKEFIETYLIHNEQSFELGYFLSPSVKHLFGSNETFRKLVNLKIQDSAFVEEFNRFYKQFQSNGYASNFSFKVIRPSSEPALDQDNQERPL